LFSTPGFLCLLEDLQGVVHAVPREPTEDESSCTRDKGLEEVRVVELDPANLEHALAVMPGVLYPTAAGLECVWRSLSGRSLCPKAESVKPCWLLEWPAKPVSKSSRMPVKSTVLNELKKCFPLSPQ
jgi:hypothetical protein